MVEDARTVLPNVFALGCFRRVNVTMTMQQVRAFNLAWALSYRGRLGPSRRVAVIGAGLAGLTFAMAAKVRGGCEVTVFEQTEALFGPPARGKARYVHPSLFRRADLLAEPDGDDDRSGLPFFNWRADTADRVIDQIRASWDRLQSTYPVHVRTSTRVTGVERAGKKTLISTDAGLAEMFDVVVIATGYGPDASGYWASGDSADYVGKPDGARLRAVVSGCGDAGLLDVFNLCLRGFVHAEVAELLQPLVDAVPGRIGDCAELDAMMGEGLANLNATSNEDLIDEALRMAHIDGDHPLVGCLDRSETQARRLDPQVTADRIRRHVADYYAERQRKLYDEELEIPEAALAPLRCRLRSDAEVILNGQGASPYSLTASVWNKLVLAALRRVGALQYRPGSFSGGEPGVPVFIGGQEIASVDRVFVRHGPRREQNDWLGALKRRSTDLSVEVLSVQGQQPFMRAYFATPAILEEVGMEVAEGRASDWREDLVRYPVIGDGEGSLRLSRRLSEISRRLATTRLEALLGQRAAR